MTDYDGRFDNHERYLAELARFRQTLAEYAAFSDPEDNDRIRTELGQLLTRLEALGSSEALDRLGVQLDQLAKRGATLAVTGPEIRAFVYYFNRTRGELYLAGYAHVSEAAWAQPKNHLALEDRRHCVFEELGPVEFNDYAELFQEIWNNELTEEFDLAEECQQLVTLAVLRCYSLLKTALANRPRPERWPGLTVAFPCLYYVQEHDGGFCDLLHPPLDRSTP